MRWQWLHRAGKGKLLVFCNGWGMDGEVVSHLLPGDFDVLMLFDYSALALPGAVEEALAVASCRYLFGWSMGVWIGSRLLSGYHFTRAVACNGTLCPIDKKFGISPAVFQITLENFDEKHRMDFYKGMCSRDVFPRFLHSPPKRQLINQREELSFFWGMRQELEIVPDTVLPWEKVIVARRDMIMPTRSQRLFWKGRLPVVEIDGGHYPFANWEYWSDCLAL